MREQQRENRADNAESSTMKRARKVVITSGKGGVGKSNVSLNLAIALAKLGRKVLLIDADTNLANIDILLGVQIKHTLSDVIFGSKFFEEIIVDGPEGLKIMPGSSGVVEILNHDIEVRRKLFDAFDQFDREFDIMLIDTGAGLTENIIDFVAGADDVILITNSEPTSITDAYAMVKIAIHRVPTLKIHVMVNLAVNREAATDTFEKLQLAVRNFLQVELDLLGMMPFDSNIPAAVAERKPFLVAYPRCSASTAMMMIGRKLLKLPYNKDEGESFIARIFKQKGA